MRSRGEKFAWLGEAKRNGQAVKINGESLGKGKIIKTLSLALSPSQSPYPSQPVCFFRWKEKIEPTKKRVRKKEYREEATKKVSNQARMDGRKEERKEGRKEKRKKK